MFIIRRVSQSPSVDSIVFHSSRSINLLRKWMSVRAKQKRNSFDIYRSANSKSIMQTMPMFESQWPMQSNFCCGIFICSICNIFAPKVGLSSIMSSAKSQILEKIANASWTFLSRRNITVSTHSNGIMQSSSMFKTQNHDWIHFSTIFILRPTGGYRFVRTFSWTTSEHSSHSINISSSSSFPIAE